jgi:O-antigen/teichoic acid export membrane protein
VDRLTSSRFRRLGREFLLITLGQAAVVLGALFGVRLLTGLLSPDVYGELALGMTVATLIGGTLFGPLGSGATRFFAPAREAVALQSYFMAVKSLMLWATGGVLLLALIVCLGLAASGHSQWLGLGLAALCFALFSGYNSVLNGMQNAARQRAVVALHQGLASWGRFLLAAGLVVWLGASSTIAMLGYAMAILVVLVSQSWFFRKTLAPGRDGFATAQPAQGQWRADMFAYAWPFATWGVLTWTQVASQRWALQLFSSTRDVGYYAVLYQLGYYPITIVTTLMVQLVSPVLFQRAGDGCDKARMAHVYALNWRLVYIAGGLTALAFLPVLWLHDRVFAVLVAPEYASVSHLLPWMLLAGGLFATGQAASLSLMSSLESKRLLAPKVVTAVLGIVVSYVGAALFGTAGVVGGGVLFGIVYLIWVLAITVGQHRQFVRSRDTEAETALA